MHYNFLYRIKSHFSLIYLNDALKIPATNIPGKPGKSPRIFITINGSNWSFFLANPVVKGSQSAYVAYKTKPE